MKKSFLTILLNIFVVTSGNYLCFAQNTSSNKSKKLSKTEKIKKKVESIGIGGKITVIKMNNGKSFGTVVEINDDNFQIKDVDSPQTLSFAYLDLKKVTTGDGERNLFTGQRHNPKKGWLYGIAIFGTLFIILGVALSDKNF